MHQRKLWEKHFYRMYNQSFISRTLSKIEQTYAQIKKECLAIVFACERFNQYLHGRPYHCEDRSQDLDTHIQEHDLQCIKETAKNVSKITEVQHQ